MLVDFEYVFINKFDTIVDKYSVKFDVDQCKVRKIPSGRSDSI